MTDVLCGCGCGKPARKKWASESCRARTRIRNSPRLTAPFVAVADASPGHAFQRYMLNLLELAEDNPGAQLVGYRISRLVNVWLAGLPAETLHDLLERENRTDPGAPAVTWPTRYDGFRIDYLPDHFFRVRFGKRKATVHDVWRFFGVPLDATLAAWKVDDLPELMDRFRDGCIDVGVLPRAWEGPGAGASVLLQRWGIKDHLAISHPATPDAVLAAARFAYGAHRFECMLPGEHPRAWHYDIRRAYPWAATQVPDWHAGTWHSRAGRKVGTDQLPALWHVAWRCPPPHLAGGRAFGPFMWRYPSGEVCFPLEGQNWVWGPELAAALALWGPECFEIHDGWVFIPDPGSVSPWRESMAVWPLANTFPPLKKMLNACPGKLAQAHPHPGPHFDPASAGLVTSIVRARILELMGDAGNALVAVLGDGLITRRPMDWPTGELPGELSSAEWDDLLMVQPSVYFVGGQVSAKGDGSHAFAGTAPAFRQAWRESGISGAVDVPFRHQTSIAEGLASGARIGDWVDAVQTIGFAQDRRRLPGRAVEAQGVSYVATKPITRPDDLVLLTATRGRHIRPTEQRPDPNELTADHSTPFWGQDYKPLAPPVESWPGSGDDV